MVCITNTRNDKRGVGTDGLSCGQKCPTVLYTYENPIWAGASTNDSFLFLQVDVVVLKYQ